MRRRPIDSHNTTSSTADGYRVTTYNDCTVARRRSTASQFGMTSWNHQASTFWARTTDRMDYIQASWTRQIEAVDEVQADRPH